MFKEKIIIEMKEVFKEIPFGIEHTLKVLKNAEDIMNGENIGEEEKEFISIIGILHDIDDEQGKKIKSISTNIGNFVSICADQFIVRRGSMLDTYDAWGKKISSRAAR